MNVTYIWEHPRFKTSLMIMRMHKEIDSDRLAAAIIRDALVKDDGVPRFIVHNSNPDDAA